ncbi:MAG TPA: cupredoxin domain-containing protein [Candidatus Paceibacterota bacterium]|nr:cupredoxin domain-containing protein [Candidatus Paceibacterota bacterium]
MKAIIISIIVAIAIIGGVFMLTRSGNTGQVANVNNVSIVDGKQIIEINAKGGYQPRKSIAKAGIHTIIRFNTKGTFDCSSSVRISSLNITKSLPQSGTTDIDIGSGQPGTLKGSCGMGMYPFEVEFQTS